MILFVHVSDVKVFLPVKLMAVIIIMILKEVSYQDKPVNVFKQRNKVDVLYAIADVLIVKSGSVVAYNFEGWLTLELSNSSNPKNICLKKIRIFLDFMQRDNRLKFLISFLFAILDTISVTINNVTERSSLQQSKYLTCIEIIYNWLFKARDCIILCDNHNTMTENNNWLFIPN